MFAGRQAGEQQTPRTDVINSLLFAPFRRWLRPQIVNLIESSFRCLWLAVFLEQTARSRSSTGNQFSCAPCYEKNGEIGLKGSCMDFPMYRVWCIESTRKRSRMSTCVSFFPSFFHQQMYRKSHRVRSLILVLDTGNKSMWPVSFSSY